VHRPIPPCLVLGETGTGKELIARLDSHHIRPPMRAVFKNVNLRAIPDLSRELFGPRGCLHWGGSHQKMAAYSNMADTGTLFLDTSEISHGLSLKLLRGHASAGCFEAVSAAVATHRINVRLGCGEPSRLAEMRQAERFPQSQ